MNESDSIEVTVNGDSDIDSEDEWYARMEQAAHDNTVDSSVNDICYNTFTSKQEDSEDQYFETVWQHNCQLTDAMFKPETDSVWNNVFRTAPSNHRSNFVVVDHKDIVCLCALKDFLYCLLPKSSHLLNQILQCIRCVGFGEPRIFTDDKIHPTIVMTVARDREAQRLDIALISSLRSIDVDWSAVYTSIRELSNQLGLFDVMLTSLSSDMHSALTSALGGRMKEMWVEACDMYCNLAGSPSGAALPVGYIYSPLRCL